MSKPSIYDLHDKAFANVSAYVILRKRETVAIKFPRDGAGRLWAYVHWKGVPMVRGYASGFGYDKRTAAVSACAPKILAELRDCPEYFSDEYRKHGKQFADAIAKDNGFDWTDSLFNAGFTVLQAV